MRLFRLLAVAFVATQLAACATVVEGTDDLISFESTPPGARCLVDRDGARIGTVDATPGSLKLSKSKNALSVTCDKAGQLTVTEQVESEFTGSTFGNILLGGGVGLIVDAATGANNRYPNPVKLLLPPEKFPTTGERDSYFDTLKGEITQKYDGMAKKTRDTCPASQPGQCESELAKVDEKRQKELSVLESKRSAVKIG
ncbi:XdhC family protein [Elstera litoralis]|uniref:XdhC family protein n=1 Tax=Elstera litoralis TaxID=552518 RepID=UPI000696D694|nr:XdhC family protein [Elstera litoralis]